MKGVEGPFDDGSCLGGDDDWTAESGRTLEYLETQVSRCKRDVWPLIDDVCCCTHIFY